MIDDTVVMNRWHPVAHMDEVQDEPVGRRLLEEDIVLWKSEEGILAWKDLCLHRGTRLSMGQLQDGTLECPYHGWTYNPQGQCVKIPAHPDQPPPKKFTVKKYRAKVKYDLVWVCLGEPEYELPPFEEWFNDDFRTLYMGSYEVEAAAPRVVENFLDVGHFAFVHEGILGDRSRPEIPDYSTEINENGIVARDVKTWQPDPDGSGAGGWVSDTYHTYGPFVVTLTQDKEGDRRHKLFGAVTPVETTRSILWLINSQNFNKDIPDEKLIKRQEKITLQDVPIVESQRPELLPLDLQSELHRPADRCSIAYRKWLNQKDLSFGTA